MREAVLRFPIAELAEKHFPSYDGELAMAIGRRPPSVAQQLLDVPRRVLAAWKAPAWARDGARAVRAATVALGVEASIEELWSSHAWERWGKQDRRRAVPVAEIAARIVALAAAPDSALRAAIADAGAEMLAFATGDDAAEVADALARYGDDLLPAADGPLGATYAGFAPRTRVKTDLPPVALTSATDDDDEPPESIAADAVLRGPPAVAFRGRPGALHAVLVVSLDAPVKQCATYRGYVHLARCDVPGGDGGAAAGRELVPYVAPVPPLGAGAWRCAVLVFEQPPALAPIVVHAPRRAGAARVASATKLVVSTADGGAADGAESVSAPLPADAAAEFARGGRGPFDAFEWAAALGLELVGLSAFAVGAHTAAPTPALIANQEAFWKGVRAI